MGPAKIEHSIIGKSCKGILLGMITLSTVQVVNTQLAHPIMQSKEPLQLRRQVESALALLVQPTFSTEVVKMEMAYMRDF